MAPKAPRWLQYHITRPGPIRVRGGVLGWTGGGGERMRMMTGKKWNEGANTQKKLQLQIGPCLILCIDQSFAA